MQCSITYRYASVVSVWPGTHLENCRFHIAVCALLEILLAYLFSLWLHSRLTVTSVLLAFSLQCCSPATCVSLRDAGQVRLRTIAHGTRLRYYLGYAKCNQLVSSLPCELAGSRCCASARGTSRTLWPELCDEEGTFGPLVVYTSPVNVFYFYLLGV